MKNRIKILVIMLVSGVMLAGVTLNDPDSEHSLDLPTIMRLLSSDIQLINEGIYTENYKLIEQGAAAINEHPPLSDETRGLLRETLGTRMQAFAQYDKLVHDTADSLKNAALNQNMGRVLEQYQIIQNGCVSCHGAFRSEIVQARMGKSDTFR
ncbi:MAG: hypothetical protein ACQER4_05050 [Bacteroidota bacterium]